jgi:DNA-binding MarR family transcriptional regulator
MTIKDMPGHLIRRLQQHSTLVFTTRMREAGHDITSVQFAAMDALTSQPGIDQATVAALIAYDRATIGGVIDRLESKGLVERTVSEQDRRARVVRLTDRGRQLYTQLLPLVDAVQEEILAPLPNANRDNFIETMQLLIAGIERHD